MGGEHIKPLLVESFNVWGKSKLIDRALSIHCAPRGKQTSLARLFGFQEMFT